jgi:hypothetical protein
MQREGTTLVAGIAGAKKLYLIVSEAGDNTYYDHADWIDPVIYKPNGDSLLLTSLKWASATSGFATVQANKSVDGKPFTVNGKNYENGFGTHANSTIEFDLPPGYTKFKSFCGYDDEVKSSFGTTVEFLVFTQDPANNSVSPFTADLNEFGLSGKCKIRDLWAKKDLGIFSGSQFAPEIENHGARLYRVSPLGRENIARIEISVATTGKPNSEPKPVVATISLPASSKLKPTGSVVFMMDGEIVGIVKVDDSGKAEYFASDLKPGNHFFTATYSGNAGIASKESEKVSIHVD